MTLPVADVCGQAVVDRRSVLKSVVAFGVAAGSMRAFAGATTDIVVETSYGKVRGRTVDGVQVFRGIPYAASTAGPNRFLPPQPLAPWPGVRDALNFGPSAPQPQIRAPERAGFVEIEPVSEDCLYLNVFTPHVGTSARRPVMVWLHGGAWVVGAGTAPALNGSNLAKLGDVVVVTINHRLNVFGYLRLDDSDERFADSGNAGVLDMVAALTWVRDNAAVFGGNPSNVTIFGQSGGGGKVSALMATPAAKGLFHKAIAQSCSGSLRLLDGDEAVKSTQALAQQLGVEKLTGETLQSSSLQRLMAARGAFRPSIDGRTFARHPFDPDAPSLSSNVPFMAGNAATETRIQMASAGLDNFSLSAAEVQRRLARFLKTEAAETGRIVDAYRTADPTASASDILGAVTSDYIYIRNTRREATLQAAQGAAPVYSYLFMRRTPVLGGILRTPHESEVAFVFGDPTAAWMVGGDGPDIMPLRDIMVATWSAFARTGNPNNPAVPHWPRHEPKDRFSLLLNVASRVERDPGGRARAALDHLPFYDYGMPTNYTRPGVS